MRYPRGGEVPGGLPQGKSPAGLPKETLPEQLYRVNCLRPGQDITLAALGTMAGQALAAAELLQKEDIEAEVLAITCAKPLDLASLAASTARTGRIIFIEEALVKGGLGQTALPDLLAGQPGLQFALLGLEDKPLCQGKRNELLALENLDAESIADRALHMLGRVG